MIAEDWGNGTLCSQPEDMIGKPWYLVVISFSKSQETLQEIENLWKNMALARVQDNLVEVSTCVNLPETMSILMKAIPTIYPVQIL